MRFNLQSFAYPEQIIQVTASIFVSYSSFFKYFFFSLSFSFQWGSETQQPSRRRLSLPGEPSTVLGPWHYFLLLFCTTSICVAITPPEESHYFRQVLIFPASILLIFWCWAFSFVICWYSSRRHDLILKQHMFKYTVFS